MIDLFGHIFYAFLLLGMICLAYGHRVGWWYRIIGEVGWVVLGVCLDLSSIVLWGMLFVGVDVVGLYRWTKQ